MDARNIFFSSDGSVRAGWRAGFFGVAFFVLAAVFLTIAFLIVRTVELDPKQGSPLFLVTNSAALLLASIMAGWISGRLFESLYLTDLGVGFESKWHLHLVVGFALGAAAIAVAVAIAAVAGGLSFAPDDRSMVAITGDLTISFGVFAVAAAFEEALFRGYVLQTFTRSGMAWLAITLTSIFFGIVHLGNPAATWISTANTILAGVLFSVAYLRTRDLWFPFGIHLAWNWVQGSIFGIEVSGMRIVPATLLVETDRGPVWLTGESYGIEGSIACTIALLVTIAAISIRTERSKRT